MLQQTQVVTVIPYFERWMRRFGDVETLASADEQEVLALWQGLGYYRRARNLQQGARQVVARGIPKTSEEWRAISGIGKYTAGAIASIANGEPVPAIDGNVMRVFARVNNDCSKGGELERRAYDWSLACMYRKSPGDWNQALMELGATICRPRDPFCERCPISGHCIAQKHGIQHELPKKATRAKAIMIVEKVVVPYSAGQFGIRQIPEGRWWEGMWEFQRAQELHIGNALSLGTFRYSVTHHRVTISAYLKREPRRNPELRWVSCHELYEVPMPSPQRRIANLAISFLNQSNTS